MWVPVEYEKINEHITKHNKNILDYTEAKIVQSVHIEFLATATSPEKVGADVGSVNLF